MAELIKKLEGTLVYVQLHKPADCWDRAKGQEWKASVVVDEDTADLWEEQFPKQAAKAVKTADFAGIYKIEAPYPGEKKQYIITVRKNVKLGNGETVPELYQPKVLLEAEGRKDVTATITPANGSTGVISLDIWESAKGPVARLKNVLVKDLIEYEGGSGGSYNPGDEFGDDAEPEPEVKPEKTIKVTKPKAAPKADAPEPAKAEDKPLSDPDDPF
jgi:hypothetical protein